VKLRNTASITLQISVETLNQFCEDRGGLAMVRRIGVNAGLLNGDGKAPVTSGLHDADPPSISSELLTATIW